MKFFKSIALMYGFFIAFSVSLFAQGREVTIFLKDGTQKSGELLSVRDTVISVLKNSVEHDEEIAAYPEMVEVTLVKDIDKVLLAEYDVSGAGKGALIGAGVGAGISLIAASSVPEYEYRSDGYVTRSTVSYPAAGFAGALGGAFYGMLIGWGVATIMSEDEEIVRPSVTKGLSFIREYARFNEQEPRYVRDIIDNLLKSQK